MNDDEKARLAALGERMKDVSAIRRRSQAWVEAGRPGVFLQTEVIQRIEELEYALKSFAQFYAAHDCKLARPSEPHADWFAIVDSVFARGGALGLMELSNITASDREALLLEMAMRDQEQSAELKRERSRGFPVSVADRRSVALTQEQVDMWDAVNEYASACGGDTGEATVSDRRMSAVVRVTSAVSAVIDEARKGWTKSEDPDQPGMYGEGTYP